ncbi:hypothetical protein N7505_001378 [Penicillium chrysogenum]|uniref:Uncharacterized protein n=1 Tax=Penicillium chrysogenum TaxID=5076 RepID=A0ABQ8WWV1_PENCH|nr:hypothetical protein N7505_001378 [Penicillium chrysogenum]
MEGQLRTLAADPGGTHDATAMAGSVLSGDFKETSPWLACYPMDGLRENSTWPDNACSSVLWNRPSSGIRREQRNAESNGTPRATEPRRLSLSLESFE